MHCADQPFLFFFSLCFNSFKMSFLKFFFYIQRETKYTYPKCITEILTTYIFLCCTVTESAANIFIIKRILSNATVG